MQAFGKIWESDLDIQPYISSYETLITQVIVVLVIRFWAGGF